MSSQVGRLNNQLLICAQNTQRSLKIAKRSYTDWLGQWSVQIGQKSYPDFIFRFWCIQPDIEEEKNQVIGVVLKFKLNVSSSAKQGHNAYLDIGDYKYNQLYSILLLSELSFLLTNLLFSFTPGDIKSWCMFSPLWVVFFDAIKQHLWFCFLFFFYILL